MKDSNERRVKKQFVVEGAILAAEAALSDYEILMLLYTSTAKERYPEPIAAATAKAEQVYIISEDIAEKISSLHSSQGILCVLEQKEAKELQDILHQERILLLESISEPSNIGAISRAALAFGFDTLVLSETSADVYSPKSLRASMGALLQVDLIVTSIPKAIETLKEEGYTVIAAAIAEDAKRIEDVDKDRKIALVVGNETRGLNKTTIALCDITVQIEINRRVQSLNAAVAASVLMYSLRG